MNTAPQQFTASSLARALGKSRQHAQRMLGGTAPAGTVIVGGNPAHVWRLAEFPQAVKDALVARAAMLGYASIDELFARPVTGWKPALPLNKISQRCIDVATKLQRAMRRALALQENINVSRVEREKIGMEDYAQEFGEVITDRYLRKLVKRTMDRDGGAGDWERLEIYLSEKPEAKKAPAQTVLRLAPELCGLHEFVSTVKTPNVYYEESTWTLAFASYQKLKTTGIPSKRAARQVRNLLASNAQYLAPSRDALLKAFNRRLQNFEASGGDCRAVLSRRSDNGERVEVPDSDLETLRASAAFANGGRVDAAWREKYPDLSEPTRNRWPFSMEAPRKIHELLVREKVDALTARHMRGKLTVRRMIGGVERSWESVPSMNEWVVDDMTSNKAWCEWHLGESRFVSLKGINNKTAFFREIAKALGIPANYSYQSAELQCRIEDVLQRSKLMLVVDEAHFAFAQGTRIRNRPELLDWINTSIANRSIPIALVTTPQFMICMTRAAAQVDWNYRQFRRRVRRYVKLPAKNTPRDIEAVIRSVLPGAPNSAVKQALGYVHLTKRDLSAVGDIVDEIKARQGREVLEKVTYEEVTAVIDEHLVPSEKNFVEAITDAEARMSGKSKRSRQVVAIGTPESASVEDAPVETDGEDLTVAENSNRIANQRTVNAPRFEDNLITS